MLCYPNMPVYLPAIKLAPSFKTDCQFNEGLGCFVPDMKSVTYIALHRIPTHRHVTNYELKLLQNDNELQGAKWVLDVHHQRNCFSHFVMLSVLLKISECINTSSRKYFQSNMWPKYATRISKLVIWSLQRRNRFSNKYLTQMRHPNFKAENPVFSEVHFYTDYTQWQNKTYLVS